MSHENKTQSFPEIIAHGDDAPDFPANEAKGSSPLSEMRQKPMDFERFRQAAEIARLAVALARGQGTEPEAELNRAWTLIQAARELIAPKLSEEQAVLSYALANSGSAEAFVNAEEWRDRKYAVPLELLTYTGSAQDEKREVEIQLPSKRGEDGALLPVTVQWTAMKLEEGFRDLVLKLFGNNPAAERLRDDFMKTVKKEGRVSLRWFLLLYEARQAGLDSRGEAVLAKKSEKDGDVVEKNS